MNPISGKNVFFDDCIQASAVMVDAKGPGYAKLFSRRIPSTKQDGRHSKIA